MSPSRFEGRRALVTGGASGIGFATAQRLRDEGAAVALIDRHEGATTSGAELAVVAIRADVTDIGAVDRAVAEAADTLGGPVDVLVNAAGIYRIAPLLDITAAAWDEVLDVNLRGSFLVGSAVARSLTRTGGGGAIVNIASVAAVLADPNEPAAHYGASKAGIVALTRQMAVEWAAFGIRANAVSPGLISTPMLRMMDDPEAGEAYLRARVPLRRVGSAEEVAACIAFLASEDAAYVTGTTLVVDGGLTAM